MAKHKHIDNLGHFAHLPNNGVHIPMTRPADGIKSQMDTKPAAAKTAAQKPLAKALDTAPAKKANPLDYAMTTSKQKPPAPKSGPIAPEIRKAPAKRSQM